MSKHGPRVRVDYNSLKPSALRQPREKIGMILARLFKRRCQDYGIGHMMKEKEFFVGKSEKRRKKKLKAKIAVLKAAEEKLQGVGSNNNRPSYEQREWEYED